MHIDDVLAGLQDLLGGPAELQTVRQRPWLVTGYGSPPGQVQGAVRAQVPDRSVIVKINPAQGIGQTLTPRIIGEFGVALSRPYGTFEAAAATCDTGRREPAAYSLHALRDVLPAEIGRFEVGGETALVLEDLGDPSGLDPAAVVARWPMERIEHALRSAASFHAATAGRDYPWTILRPSTTTMTADDELWRVLARDAATRFPDIITPDVLAGRLLTVDTIPQWHPAKDQMPACLVHNSFSQRNIGFRDDGEPVLLDWSLARVDIPQCDVVELLTFTLDAHTPVDDVLHLLAVHWQALADNGMEVDPELYAAAAAAQFRVQSLDHIGHHLLFGTVLDLRYLRRVNLTIDHLVALTA